MSLTISEEQWDTLISLAQQGATTAEARRQVETFLLEIEEANSIVRYSLRVRWQEAGAMLPANVSFPRSWPPEYEITIRKLGVPVLRSDVETAVRQRAKNPVSIMVSKDPGGEYGWQTIDQYFR